MAKQAASQSITPNFATGIHNTKKGKPQTPKEHLGLAINLIRNYSALDALELAPNHVQPVHYAAALFRPRLLNAVGVVREQTLVTASDTYGSHKFQYLAKPFTMLKNGQTRAISVHPNSKPAQIADIQAVKIHT